MTRIQKGDKAIIETGCEAYFEEACLKYPDYPYKDTRGLLDGKEGIVIDWVESVSDGELLIQLQLEHMKALIPARFIRIPRLK